MRSLQRNWRDISYAIPTGTESIYDEYGNDTLEKRILYSPQEKLRVNISANVGQEAINVFGALTGYSRTVTYSGESCPIVEGSKIWFGVDASTPNNYIVIKVADSKNGFAIALREVSKRG